MLYRTKRAARPTAPANPLPTVAIGWAAPLEVVEEACAPVAVEEELPEPEPESEPPVVEEPELEPSVAVEEAPAASDVAEAESEAPLEAPALPTTV